MKRLPRTTSIWAAVGIWCLVLLGVGIANRWSFGVRTAAWSTPVVLERPLSSVPSRIGSWVGQDMPIEQRVLEVAGTDDHVNRRYVDRDSGQVVDFYLAYTARPANMLGHRPRVCYPAHGWSHVATKPDRLTLPDGTRLDCLIHHFTQERLEPVGLVVLNYYVLQGRHTTEWTSFWGPKWRRPNLARDPKFYVAQVQVVASAMVPDMWEREEEAVRRFAAVVTPHVIALLPLAEEAGEGQAVSTTPEDVSRP